MDSTAGYFFFLQQIVVKLFRNFFILVVHVVNVPTALIVYLVNRPQRLPFGFALVRGVDRLPQLVVQRVQRRFQVVVARRLRMFLLLYPHFLFGISRPFGSISFLKAGFLKETYLLAQAVGESDDGNGGGSACLLLHKSRGGYLSHHSRSMIIDDDEEYWRLPHLFVGTVVCSL